MSSRDELFKPIKLDRDIVADRRRSIDADPLRLKIPDDIQINREVLIEILDHKIGDQYDIHFSSGTWNRQESIIRYTPTRPGTVKLTVRHNNEILHGLVVLPNGRTYDDKGNLGKKNLEDTVKVHKLEFQYDAVVETIPDINYTVPPIATNHDGGINSRTSKLLDYDVKALFGDLDSRKIQEELSSKKNGSVQDYFLPSEENKESDSEPGIFQQQDGKIGFVPRNSNVTESGEDVLSGYRKPGAIGGSLTVILGDEWPKRTDVFEFEVLNKEIDAVLPDDIMALCLTNVAINPILKGDPTGHTFQWEQIKGDDTSVTWLTPKDQPEFSIHIGAIKADRVFRFWINRGTSYEKYYDITIYGTPFEEVSMFGTSPSSHDFGNHLVKYNQETTPILLWHRNVWNKQLRLRIRRND